MNARIFKFAGMIAFFIFLLTVGAPLAAQSNKIKILEVRPYNERNIVGLQFVLSPFFSAKVSGTIQSGLPSVLEIEFFVKDKQNKILSRRLIFRRISYNIWEEKYRIDSPDTSMFFKQFAALQNRCLLPKSRPFLPVEKINSSPAVTIFARARLRLISSSQSRKLVGWLDQSYQANETISSDESSSGFRLNFSTLVALFMGNSPDKNGDTRWQEFPLLVPGKD